MRNTTKAELIQGIRDLDTHLGNPVRKGLSSMLKADVFALHERLADEFLRTTQPEMSEHFYHCDVCGENVLALSRPEHDSRHAEQDESVNEPIDGTEVAAAWLALSPEFQTVTPEDMVAHLARVPSPDREYQSSQEALAVVRQHLSLPITETDVTPGTGAGPLVVLVQSGTRLVWGKLIAVVNRRTRYQPPILATVEVDGVRRLIRADDMLAA